MQNSPNLDKPLTLNSFVLHQIFHVVQFSHKLEPFHNGPFKITYKPTEVTYELLTQDGKTFHTHRNQEISYYPKELMLFPHIQSYNERKSEVNHYFDTSHMVPNDLYTSIDNSDSDDKVFDDDPFCKNNGDQLFMFDNELSNSVTLDDNYHHTSRTKFDSETLHYKAILSKFQSLNKFSELFDLPETDIFHDPRKSFANQTNSCFSTNHKLLTETLDSNMIYNHYRKKLLSFHHITFLSG